MVIHLISSNQDPRQPAPPAKSRFRLDLAEFPELPGVARLGLLSIRPDMLQWPKQGMYTCVFGRHTGTVYYRG
jgi:hypothetical protein